MQKDTRTGKITIYHQGENYSLKRLAEKYKVNPSTLRRRIDKGLPLDEALNI
jgi:uncharacterized protein YjcR